TERKEIIMDSKKLVIGIAPGISTPGFVQMIVSALHSQVTSDGSKPIVETVKLDWHKPPQSASALTKEGDKKIRAYEEILHLASRGVSVVAIPNFAVMGFISELQTECTVPIADMGVAVAKCVAEKNIKKLGMLGDPGSTKAKEFEKRFEKYPEIKLIWPDPPEVGKLNEFYERMMSNKFIENGAKTALDLLTDACTNLSKKDVEIILPTCVRQIAYTNELQRLEYKLINVAEAYAHYLCTTEWMPYPAHFKLGIVGGLGPMATVDLYKKITMATPAKKDQEHIKIAIEQNPQVADRTVYLLHGGEDPTLALYAACKKLEDDGVDAILFPCNTAHAYLGAIAPHLKVPVINMMQVTMEEIKEQFGSDVVVGLMATDGTCQSGLYDIKAKDMGLQCVKPDPEYQKLVMESIYGEKGVKAGFTDGICRDQLLQAAEHLVKQKSAGVLVLGCTELPLILSESKSFEIGGKKVGIVDPTAAVARKAVKVAMEETAKRGRR
ncbi:MAG: amino acid racemase, partial [Burkholderiales bacterium]|nr:amino acid racemase [Burkholderiales bacterium]